MSTDLLNLVLANSKVGLVPDSRESLIYSIGIARGMRHLHSLGIAHRDLKSSNVLVRQLVNFKMDRLEKIPRQK